VINRWSILAAFTTAHFLSQFFRSVNAVIAPTLAQEFGFSAADLGLMTSLFFATFALTQFPLGIALDRWGARRVTAGLMSIAVIGSLVFAFGSSFVVLALGRILLGIGLAGILMGGIKALSEWFPQARFASITGLLTGIGSLGGLVSTSPMAWLNEQVGWRSVFIGGALLTALSLTYILIGTCDRPLDTPPQSPKDAENHLRDIFGSISFWRIAAPVIWVGGVGTAFRALWAGPYLYDIYALPAIATGNLLLLMGIGGIAGSILLGWLVDRFGAVRVVVTCTLILIACQILLASQSSLLIVAFVYLLMGFAGSFPVALLAQARHIFPAHMRGQAFSMLNMTAFAGTFLLQWWMGEIVAFFPATVVGHSSPQAYTVVLSITAAGSVLALFCYLPLLWSQRKQQKIVQ
jgi:predicted MFS family arabinose efflux permease